MRGIESRVAANYGGGGVLDRVLAGLRAAGVDPEAMGVEDLRPFESLHIGGWQATEDLLAQLGIAAGDRLVDLGCGIGGTARTAAARYGAQVSGVDLTPEFVAVAEVLSRMAGVTGVAFSEGSVLGLPFDAGRFDFATMLHVGMNIEDKPGLFAEAARVLRPGGVFAIYDLMRVGAGELPYPMPWAAKGDISFVEAPEVYAGLAREAGFVEQARRDRSEFGIAGMEAMRDRGPVSGGIPPERLANVLGAVKAGILAPVELILRRE